MRWVALLACWAAPAGAESLALAEVLARVEARGPESLAAGGDVPVAAAEVHTAKMFPNPGVTFLGGLAEPVFGASVTLRLPIFGQRGARMRAAEGGLEEVQRETSQTRWHLRHEARVAYYSLERADEEVAIAVEVEALTRRIAEMAREKYEVGTGTRLDERQAELVHVRTSQDVVDRRALARVARLELQRQLGVVGEGELVLGDPLARTGTTPSLDELLAAARAQHPAMLTARAQERAAQARARAARAELRPAPTLELGLELDDPSTCGGTSRCVGPRVALGLDLPVFNWNGGPVERARAEAQLARLRGAVAAERIEAGVRAAWENLQAAIVRARFFDAEYVPNAAEVETMAREAFAVGKSGILPLIEAERAVLDARLGRAEALFEVQSARADLEEQSGVQISAP